MQNLRRVVQAARRHRRARRRIMRGIVGPLAAAVVVLAGGAVQAAPLALGLTAPPEDPADPAFKTAPDEAAVGAWVQTRLQLPEWRYVGYARIGALFVPAEIPLRAGRVLAPVRLELFRPEAAPDGRTYRSMEVTIELDCADRTFVPRRYVAYAGHDLHDPIQDVPAPPSQAWTAVEPDDLANAELLKACAAAEGPRSLAEVDVLPWIARMVKPGGDAFAYYDSDGAWYVRGPMTGASADVVGFLGRSELFEPDAGARSRTVRVELDCSARRLRFSQLRDYPQHNLEGEGSPSETPAGWLPPETGEQSLQMDRLCAMAGRGRP
jgi:hypothetical protein